jgi:hypothetical protein
MTPHRCMRLHGHMKRLLAGMVSISALVIMVATPAAAGESITVTGDFAPGGTVTVSGNQCVGTTQADEQVPGEVTVSISGGDPVANVAFAGDVVSPPPGNWSVELTIADTAQPGEQYTVSAGCTRLSVGEPVSFDYPDVLRIMGEPVTPTTPTTGPPPSETTTTVSAEDAAQASAGGASSSPRFAG